MLGVHHGGDDENHWPPGGVAGHRHHVLLVTFVNGEIKHFSVLFSIVY